MWGKLFGRHKPVMPEIPGGPVKDPDKAWKPPNDGPIIPENWRHPRDPEPTPEPPEREPPKDPPED